MENTDRRIRRTRKSLEDALIALALAKPYDEITIQEITDRADIGYRTFYRHYADKEELLRDVLHTTIVEMLEIIAPPQPQDFTDPNVFEQIRENSERLFRHVQKNSDLYRVLLRSERTFIESVMEHAINETMTNFGSEVDLGIPIEIIANHTISSTFALVRWWLDNDMRETPEAMAEYSLRLIARPASQFMLQQ
jgi:AcrR family transcriptional regulator